jgi:hypothetical protein
MPDDLPGLEHQNTIVRQVSNTSASNMNDFSFCINQAIEHFSIITKSKYVDKGEEN